MRNVDNGVLGERASIEETQCGIAGPIVIRRGAEVVPIAEVETHLCAHPHVREAALVGFPDAVLGERSCAFVVPRGGPPTRRDLVEHLRRRDVALHALPDLIRFVHALPSTAAGEVDRSELSRRLEHSLLEH